MLMQLKMYFRFVVWLLKKVVSFGGFIPEVYTNWKDTVKYEFGMSLLMYFLVTMTSMASSLAGWFIMHSDERPSKESLIVPICLSSALYVIVLVAGLYEVFLAEYEKTFTILKKDDHV